eukprot:TRINITY_DN328_c0_g1_i1.p1 TRINITY_DN328_c0_g1~~TRINITY_DN328_c0_g1_i1.p1  ORF type:complete len:484 (+),score=46.95 TRINITY_DN328_c0_g1_i1:38-1453(+)
MVEAMGGGIAPFVLVAGCCLMNLLSTGLLLGWAGFLLMFVGEGAFHHLCDDGHTVCQEADIQLNLVFTVGFTCICVLSLPGGFVADRMSARISVPLSMMSSVAAFVILAVASSGDEEWRWYLLFVFVVLLATSQVAQFATCQLVETLPKTWRGIGAGLLSGSYGMSSLVPLLLHRAWSEAGGEGALPGIALAFAGILFMLVIFALRIPHAGPRGRESTCAHSFRRGFYLIPLGTNEDIALETESTSVWSHLCSIEYWAFLAFAISRAHFTIFYLSSVNLHLQRINPAKAEAYTAVVGWIAPTGVLAGIVGGPWVENRSKGSTRGFVEAGVTILAAHLVMCVLAWTEVLELQPPVFVLYTMSQEVLFAAIVVHIGRRFGFKHFGTLYGIFFFILGLSTMTINPIVAAATSSPQGFGNTFVAFAIGSIFSFVPLYIMFRSQERVTKASDKPCEVEAAPTSGVTVKSDELVLAI